MALNANIILQGQQPDFVNTLARATQAADLQNNAMRSNRLADLYAQQGDKIASGDQNALNALARFDPAAAQGIQAGNLNMQNTRQTMARMSAQEERAVAEYAAGISAAERAAASAKLNEAIKMVYGASSPEQWDSLAVAHEAPQLVGQFNNKDAWANKLRTMDEIMKAAAGPKWRPATPEEAAAGGYAFGQINTETGELKGTNGPRDGIEFKNADGSTISIGGNSGRKTDGPNPSSPESMVATIDGILQDPALDTATGVLAWTQNIPGTAQRRFGSRTKQLDGQAFLQAFESLKGGGQITEIEGTKATQAIGRLDTAQRPEDYRQALTELKEILTMAQQRPIGWANGQKDPSLAQGNMPEVGAVENGYIFKGGDPSDPSSWEAAQ